MNPRKLFAEMQRRNVYKVGAAYLVVAWLLIQVATQIFPFFEIPSWCVRLVIVLLILGFPVALILAWAYEMTPEGIKRTDEVTAEQSRVIERASGKRLNALIIVTLLCVIGVLLFQRFQRKSSVAPEIEKSIAVLPFDNFSDDKENAFFADGIQDDILTSLARIHDLKVISRTSVIQYRGAGKNNLRQISDALGVANVLEGSVRRGGNRVVVTVQLIDARSDRHIWAKRYDRLLEDSLGLQGELAEEIATELRATISPNEKICVDTKPTNNPDAYVLYLKARGYETSPDRLFEDYTVAERLYRDAIQQDPNFALAHARLSATIARIYHWFDSTNERKAAAKAAAERALEIKPDLGEAHLALGLYFYWGETNYDKALEELEIAAAALPNDSDIGYFRAAILRRQGKWDENLDLLKKSQICDPGNANVAEEIAFTYAFRRDWPEAKRAQDRVVALAPDSDNAKIMRAYIDFWSEGKTDLLRDTLAKIPPGTDPAGLVTRARWDLAMIRRDFDEAERVMATCPLDTFQSNGQPTPKSFYLGCIALARGDKAKAREHFDLVLPVFEEAARQAPSISIRHANLGLVYAFTDQKEKALREGHRAVELEPESKDAVHGPWMVGYLAMIHARTGDLDQAIPLLEHLLVSPGVVENTNCTITESDLRHRWQWDPVREDPRFQKLLSEPESKNNP